MGVSNKLIDVYRINERRARSGALLWLVGRRQGELGANGGFHCSTPRITPSIMSATGTRLAETKARDPP